MPRSRRAEMKKSQMSPGCFRCWLGGVECFSGTLPGYCIPCGGAGQRVVLGCFGSFFNNMLIAPMLRIAATVSVPLGSDVTYYNILEIHNATTAGLSEPHIFEIHGDFHPSNTQLQCLMDQMVWISYTSNIREKDTATDLVTKTILVRGYLALLFASNVTERERILKNGVCEYKYISGTNLSLHLTNFILFRLHSLISETLNVLLRTDHDGSEASVLDKCAALAILITGLNDAFDGLMKGRLRPLCGGVELANALCERIRGTLMQFEAHLPCNHNWAAHLNGPLDDLRASTMITNMVLTLERRFHDTPNPSADSSPCTIFDSGNTPASSTDQQSLPDTGLDDMLVSVNPERLSFSEAVPSHLAEASPSFQAAGGSGEMASQVSDPFGSNPQNHWPEQNNDTWRQFLSHP